MAKADIVKRSITLKQSHLEAIEMLTAGKSAKEAAAAVGMSRQNLSKLMHENPIFKAELERRRFEGLQELRSLLRDVTIEAANQAMALLGDKSVPPSVRLQTAVSFLNKVMSFYLEDNREPRTGEQLAGEMAETAAMSGMAAFADVERKEQLLLSAREELK